MERNVAYAPDRSSQRRETGLGGGGPGLGVLPGSISSLQLSLAVSVAFGGGGIRTLPGGRGVSGWGQGRAGSVRLREVPSQY